MLFKALELLSSIRETPRMSALESIVGAMTVGELARLTNKSVDQVVAIAFGSTTRPTSSQPASTTAAKPSRGEVPRGEVPRGEVPRGEVPRGGLAPDSILAALAGNNGPVRLEDVRAKTGGSVPQVRAALQKLAQSKKVAISGKRRGTRYQLR